MANQNNRGFSSFRAAFNVKKKPNCNGGGGKKGYFGKKCYLVKSSQKKQISL